MVELMSNAAVWLSAATVGIVIGSIVWARRSWRFDRLALRGFDLPFEPAGPFRQSEPTLRPMYGFERDPGCQIFFVLHLLACFGAIVSLAVTLWCGVAILEGIGLGATTAAALAAWLAAILSIPMWLGKRRVHGVLAGLMALFVFALWPPAVTLLLVFVVIQHDLIRRRAIVDSLELERREAHERRRRAADTSGAMAGVASA